jgi:hypothetical protein
MVISYLFLTEQQERDLIQGLAVKDAKAKEQSTRASVAREVHHHPKQ